MAGSALDGFAAKTSAMSATQKMGLAAHFWAWYAEHKDDQVARVGLLFVSFSVRVHTVKPLFELLFGPPPSPAAEPAEAA